MPGKLTRRRVLAQAAAATALAAVPVEARPLFVRGGSPAAVAATIPGVRFLNTAGTDSPADVGYPVKMEFEPGEVPSGFIAVPQVGGVDQIYNIDYPGRFWSDGSLKSIVAYVTRNVAHPAGGYVSIDFAVRPGSYSNTSSTTLADMQAADYKLAITSCHTAQIGAAGSLGLNDTADGNIVALTIGGGVISGYKIWRIDGTVGAQNCSQKNVTGGAGSGAKVSLTGGVVSIDDAGSGYALHNGTGAFTASFASALASIIASGNYTNGASVEWYARGAACDAGRVKMAIPGFPHFYVEFYIERWKKTDGSFMSWRALAKSGTGMVDTVNACPNYTYDMDWIGPDGSTVIRGASTGYTKHQTILHFAACAYHTFDETGLADWSVNHAARAAIVPMRTAAQCDHQRRAGALLSWKPYTLTATAPTEHDAYERHSTNSGIDQIGDYQPSGTAGVRCALGAGGGGNAIAPMHELDGRYWAAQRAGQTADALVYWRNLIVAAAHCCGHGQLGAGFYEPATLRTPCVVPSGVQTFTGMTPRDTLSTHPSHIAATGYSNPQIGLSSMQEATGNTYHQIRLAYGAYLATGDRWWLDATFNQGAVTLFAINPGSRRKVTLGGTSYYGTRAGYVNNIRDATWPLCSQIQALAMMPLTFADGAANPEREHLEYCTSRHIQMWLDLVSHTGNVQFGTGTVRTKANDFSGSAVFPENFDHDSNVNNIAGDVPYMLNYMMQVFAHGAYLLQGELGGRVRAWLDYIAPSFVKPLTSTSDMYYITNYRRMLFDGPQPSEPIDLSWGPLSASTPKRMLMPFAGTADPSLRQSVPRMSFTNGSDVVTLEYPVRATGPNTNILWADGSRVRLTSDWIGNTTNDGPAPPAPFDVAVNYYVKTIDDTHVNLCTDAGLTSTVTASADASNINFWVVFSNTPPPYTSGGAYRHGVVSPFADDQLSEVLHTAMLCKAMVPDLADIDTAVTNAQAMLNAQSGYPSTLYNSFTYAWDSTRG